MSSIDLFGQCRDDGVEVEFESTGKSIAVWSIELTTDCPHCKRHVDLLDDDNFFDKHRIVVGEHETRETTGMDVTCPLCQWLFKVDLAF